MLVSSLTKRQQARRQQQRRHQHSSRQHYFIPLYYYRYCYYLCHAFLFVPCLFHNNLKIFNEIIFNGNNNNNNLVSAFSITSPISLHSSKIAKNRSQLSILLLLSSSNNDLTTTATTTIENLLPITLNKDTSSSNTTFDQTTNETIDIHHHHRHARIPIVQYHDNWVCINKPPGITVHRSHNTPKHTCVLSTAVKKQLGRKVYPVHRLDHRTSGALLYAFDSATCTMLHNAISTTKHGTTATTTTKKQYIALVRGICNFGNTQRSMIVDHPVTVQGIVKHAQTKFTILATTTTTNNNDNNENCTTDASLLLCEPITGRTHQIRRHAYYIGHPIIGDSQHGDSKVNRYWRTKHEFNRLGLHCLVMEFDLPGTTTTTTTNDSNNNQDSTTIRSNYNNDNRQEIKNQQEEEKHCTCVAPLSHEFQSCLKQVGLFHTAVQQEPRLALDPNLDERGGSFGRSYKQKKRNQNEETDRI